MKTQVTHIRVNNATELFDELAAMLTNEHAKASGRVVTEDLEMGGYTWSCVARIDTEYKTTEYRDSPPEHEYTNIDVYISVIECTDKEGNEIDATYFDGKNREIGDDELIQIVTMMLTEQY